MKKLSCILLAVMLITALFVSCTAEVIDPYDGLAYVTFGGPASKDLSASYEVQSYEDLYWFYTATKTDAYGKTGETKVETPLAVENNNHMKGLGGKIGPFSQGTWKFELFAYSNSTKADGTLVYKGSVEGIKLTSSSLTSVPVSVTPQGDYGTIEFRNASFKWAGTSGEGKPTIKITAVGPQTYTLLSGLENVDESGNVPLKWKDDTLSIDQSYKNVAAGYYKCTVVAWVVDESSPIFEQSFGIRVYGSATTVISGDITEKVDSFVDFEVGQEDLVVFKGASTMEVLSTPSNASDKFTTVDFGSNLDGNKTYSLSVKSTTAAEAASKFTVSDGEASVAGIDLTLTTNNTSVTSFGSEITITTYISTGLENVRVVYNGQGGNPALIEYDKSTGKLVFTTTHFSEYYVVAKRVAEANGKYYGSLQDAIDAASQGSTITVLSDISLMKTIQINDGKEVEINLNGKTVSIVDNCFSLEGANVSISGNGRLVRTGSSTNALFWLYGSTESVSDYTVLSIGKDVVLEAPYAIAVNKNSASKEGKSCGVVVNLNGTINASVCGVYTNGTCNSMDEEAPVFNIDGAKISASYGGIYAAGYAVWNIKDTMIESANALSLKSGSFTIDGGSFRSTGEYSEPAEDSSNGSVDTGAALSMTSNDGYAKKLDVVVNSGRFESVNGYAVYEGIPNKKNSSIPVAAESYVTLVINGGEFIGNTDKGSIKLNSIKNLKVVCGGVFNSEPSDAYLKDGYTAEQDDEDPSIWTVKKAVAEVDGFYFASLEAAFEKALALENPVMTILDDIDLSGKNWIPIKIGSENNAVKSLTIEGNGHSINNMTIAIAADNNPKGAPQAGSSNYYGEGFIAEVYTKTLTIRNLTFNSANVNDSGMDETPAHHTSGVSVVVGRNCYSTVNLENVNVIDSKVYGGEKVGALIGHCMGGKTNINGGSVKNTTVTCTWYYSAMLIGFANDKAKITVNEAVLESNSNTYDLKWSDVTAFDTTTEGDTIAWEPYGNPGLWVYAAWKDQIAMTGGTEEPTYDNGTYEGKINGHALSFTKEGTAYSGDWTL